MTDFKSLMSYPTKNPYKQTKERDSENDANPRALPEVELTSDSNRVLDRYREVYKTRYGVEPILLNNGLANTQTKDLIRKVGSQRALALVEHYLRLNGDNDWYVRTGHSLKTFESKIEEINAALGLDLQRQNTVGKNYDSLIIFNTQCPNCNSWQDITCHGSQAEKHAYTTYCKSCQTAGSQS